MHAMDWLCFLIACFAFVCVKGQGLEGLGDLAKLFSAMSGQHDCKFQCPNGHKPTEDPKHRPSSNGCGSMGMKIDVSDYPGFTECCNKHDICYDTCLTNREDCDESFQSCLKDACDFLSIHKKLSKKRRKECKDLVEMMYSGTVGLGCAYFKEAQRNACLCNGKKLSKKEMSRLDNLNEL